MAGYATDDELMAATAGMLTAVADSVTEAANRLGENLCVNLGPGRINESARSLADAWSHALDDVRDRTENAAEGVRGSMANYAEVEESAARTFSSLYGQDVCVDPRSVP